MSQETSDQRYDPLSGNDKELKIKGRTITGLHQVRYAHYVKSEDPAAATWDYLMEEAAKLDDTGKPSAAIIHPNKWEERLGMLALHTVCMISCLTYLETALKADLFGAYYNRDMRFANTAGTLFSAAEVLTTTFYPFFLLFILSVPEELKSVMTPGSDRASIWEKFDKFKSVLGLATTASIIIVMTYWLEPWEPIDYIPVNVALCLLFLIINGIMHCQPAYLALNEPPYTAVRDAIEQIATLIACLWKVPAELLSPTPVETYEARDLAEKKVALQKQLSGKVVTLIENISNIAKQREFVLDESIDEYRVIENPTFNGESVDGVILNHLRLKELLNHPYAKALAQANRAQENQSKRPSNPLLAVYYDPTFRKGFSHVMAIFTVSGCAGYMLGSFLYFLRSKDSILFRASAMVSVSASIFVLGVLLHWIGKGGAQGIFSQIDQIINWRENKDLRENTSLAFDTYKLYPRAYVLGLIASAVILFYSPGSAYETAKASIEQTSASSEMQTAFVATSTLAIGYLCTTMGFSFLALCLTIWAHHGAKDNHLQFVQHQECNSLLKRLAENWDVDKLQDALKKYSDEELEVLGFVDAEGRVDRSQLEIPNTERKPELAEKIANRLRCCGIFKTASQDEGYETESDYTVTEEGSLIAYAQA